LCLAAQSLKAEKGMDSSMVENFDEDRARRRRAQRREEMRRRKQRQALFRKLLPFIIAAVLLIVVIVIIAGSGRRKDNGKQEPEQTKNEMQEKEEVTKKEEERIKEEEQKKESGKAPSDTGMRKALPSTEIGRKTADGYAVFQEKIKAESELPVPSYTATENTLRLGTEITSSYALMVDVETGEILASKEEKSRLVPASMTKVLTLLVAVEHITDLDDEFEITREITDYCYVNDCSVAGFEAGEKVTVRDLLYGAILPSGGDGALGLAVYTSGSQEAFVELMNDKLEELGLSETAHFTNCVGIYDAGHYCTAYDLAVIMEAAMRNEICREILSSRTYQTSRTQQHPEGLLISNWFLRRIEDKDTGGMTMYGKTGYVDQSGSCAVSAGIDRTGKEYICVTANSNSKWYCITDHAWLYKRFSEN